MSNLSKLLELLSSDKISINYRDTLLSIAVKEKNIKIVEKLIKLNICNDLNEFPL